MKLLWALFVVLSLFVAVTLTDGFDDDDDEGIVEEVPEETIIKEKVCRSSTRIAPDKELFSPEKY